MFFVYHSYSQLLRFFKLTPCFFACQYEIGTGPGKRMKWGCWEAPAYDGLVARGHDDLLISAALVAVLDKLDVPGDAVGDVVTARDPLTDIDRANW